MGKITKTNDEDITDEPVQEHNCPSYPPGYVADYAQERSRASLRSRLRKAKEWLELKIPTMNAITWYFTSVNTIVNEL